MHFVAICIWWFAFGPVGKGPAPRVRLLVLIVHAVDDFFAAEGPAITAVETSTNHIPFGFKPSDQCRDVVGSGSFVGGKLFAAN